MLKWCLVASLRTLVLGFVPFVGASALAEVDFSPPVLSAQDYLGESIFKDSDNNTMKIMNEKISFLWKQGSISTGKQSFLRLDSIESGTWNFGANCKLEITDKKEDLLENPFARNITLSQGILEFKSVKVKLKTSGPTVVFHTNELDIIPDIKSDIVVQRYFEEKSGLNITELFLLGGKAKITLAKKFQKNEKNKALIPLSPGVLFRVNEKGKPLPLVLVSDKKTTDIVTMFTTEEDKKLAQKKVQAYKPEQLEKKCAQLISEKQFLDVIDLLDSPENKVTLTEKMQLCLADAYKDSQISDKAIQNYNTILQKNPNSAEAYWGRGLVYFIDKKYDEAQLDFEKFKSLMPPKDLLRLEADFYIATIYFFKKDFLVAKDKLTDLSFNSSLSPKLTKSVNEFLGNIKVKKPWSLVVPIGINYTDNALSLPYNQSLPKQYSSKYSWKFLSSAIFKYDQSVTTTDPGVFLGIDTKASLINNFDPQFSALDVMAADVTLHQTIRYENGKEKDKTKLQSINFYESNGVIFLDKKQNSYYALLGSRFSYFDLNVSYFKDISNKPEADRRNGFVFNQNFSNTLGKVGKGIVSIHANTQEQLVSRRTTTYGDFFNIGLKPSILFPINKKFSISLSEDLQGTWQNAVKISSYYSQATSISFNYFLNRYVIGTLSVSEKYTKQFPAHNDIINPEGSFTLTGIF